MQDILSTFRLPRSSISLTIGVVVVMALLLGACSSTDSGSGSATTAASSSSSLPASGEAVVPTDYETFRTQPTACGAQQPDPLTEMQFTEPGQANISTVTEITMATSCGEIVISLDPSIAPDTVNSFVFLVEEGYFDGSVSHRVLPGFMMQAGDPTATGFGGPGYAVQDEFPDEGYIYARGDVAMANAGSGTTGSQFFILLADTDWLPPNYTVIGKVTQGLDALDAIESLPLAMNPVSADTSPSVPLETVYIEKVTVIR